MRDLDVEGSTADRQCLVDVEVNPLAGVAIGWAKRSCDMTFSPPAAD